MAQSVPFWPGDTVGIGDSAQCAPGSACIGRFGRGPPGGLSADPGPPRAVGPVAPAPAAHAPEGTGTDRRFDVLGLTLGLPEAAAKARAMAALGGAVLLDRRTDLRAPVTGRPLVALLAVEPAWPERLAEQVLVLFDAAEPSAGALAVVRLVRLPDDLTAARFRSELWPDLVAVYGAEGLSDDGQAWIGRAEARAGPATGCGALALALDPAPANALAALWRSGGGPRLVAAGQGGQGAQREGQRGGQGAEEPPEAPIGPAPPSVTARDCGETLTITFEAGILRIALWQSSAFAARTTEPPVSAAPHAPP